MSPTISGALEGGAYVGSSTPEIPPTPGGALLIEGGTDALLTEAGDRLVLEAA